MKTRTRLSDKEVDEIIQEIEVAKLKIKPLPTFTQVIEQQGHKKLSFEELYPFIDDSEDEYTIDDY